MVTAADTMATDPLPQARKLSSSIMLWALEIIALAGSYGVLLLAFMIWSLRSDPSHTGFVEGLRSGIILFFVVVCAAIMNFTWTGYIITSLVARFICMNKAPRLYPFVLSCLVVIHIEIIKLADGNHWALTIGEPAFLGWGIVTAFVVACVSLKLQNIHRLWGFEKR